MPTAEFMSIQGLCTEDELIFLLQSVRDRTPPRGWVVELGSFNGRSTAYLCSAVGDERVIGIDNWKMKHHGPNTMALTQQNLKHFGFEPRLISSESTVVPEGITEVAALFIDTDHRAVHLSAELRTWLPLLVPGGLVVLHDYNSPKWPEVTETADSYFLPTQWKKLGPVEMMVAFQRHSGIGDVVWNKAALDRIDFS